MVEKTEYNIYGILYVDYLDRKSCVTVSAESPGEALGMLEKWIKETDKENNNEGKRGSIHPKIKKLEAKASEKKIMFGYDVWTDEEL